MDEQCTLCGYSLNEISIHCSEPTLHSQAVKVARASKHLTISHFMPFIPVGDRNDFDISIPPNLVEGLVSAEVEIESDIFNDKKLYRELTDEGNRYVNSVPFLPIRPGNIGANFKVTCKTATHTHIFRGRDRFFIIGEWDPAYIATVLKGKRVELDANESNFIDIVNDDDVEELFIKLNNSNAMNTAHNRPIEEGAKIGKLNKTVNWDIELRLLESIPITIKPSRLATQTKTCHFVWSDSASVVYTRVYCQSQLSLGRAGTKDTDVWLGVFEDDGALNSDAQTFISRHHLSIRTGNKIEVRDESSMNGSTLNSSALKNEWVPLPHEAVLQPGRHQKLQLSIQHFEQDVLLLQRIENKPELENWVLLPQKGSLDLTKVASYEHENHSSTTLRHADGGFYIKAGDNNFIVAGETINKGESFALQDGDEISAGRHTATFYAGTGYGNT